MFQWLFDWVEANMSAQGTIAIVALVLFTLFLAFLAFM